MYLEKVVLVDRAAPGFRPDYSVAGYTWCTVCKHKVWVGHETARVLAEQDGPYPLCMTCVNDIQEERPEAFIPDKLAGHVEDGACPTCGGVHPPTADHN